MSFSANVKEELSHNIVKARHCQLAELASIIVYVGRLGIDYTTNEYEIRLESENVTFIMFNQN